MVYHDLGYSTETIFTGVFKGILHFHRFFKAKNPSSAWKQVLRRILFSQNVPVFSHQGRFVTQNLCEIFAE